MALRDSLPTLHGVYLEVVGKADDDKDDDERNLIGYASFHTEQAPPRFENVVDNLNASKVQRFCVVDRWSEPKVPRESVKELFESRVHLCPRKVSRVDNYIGVRKVSLGLANCRVRKVQIEKRYRERAIGGKRKII